MPRQHRPQFKTSHYAKRLRGFSLIELLIAITIFSIICAFAVPQLSGMLRGHRASADARKLASQLALAKMRAENAFTQSRLNCNTTLRSCQLEICTSKGAGTCNTFSSEGGPLLLSENVVFGFGSITVPAGSQTAIQNSNQILFNSRGIPVTTSGAATGGYAVYLTNQNGDTYAVTVYATGRVAVWRYDAGVWSIQ
jgi:prepilin-type N-terminal cleavage/methylation domain-containing protein